MTESTRNNKTESPLQPNGDTAASAVYSYASAGITERKGHVPKWLWAVVISLLVWGIYYLVTYWNAPLGPT